MSNLVFVDPEISTQADGAQSPRVLVPLPEDPYKAIRQAYLVGTDTKSEPFEDHVETEAPESPHTVAPPTSLPDSNPPTLVPILRRTAPMAVRVPTTMSPGLSSNMAEVEAPIQHSVRGLGPLTRVHHLRHRQTFLYESIIEDEGPTAEDKDPAAGDDGLTAKDEDPAAGDEGLAAKDEGHGMGVESLSLGGDEAVPEGQPRAAPVVETTMDSERLERVSTLRQPTLTTWIDPEDGIAYINVPTYPPPAPTAQTPPSPEWSSGSLPIFPTSSIVPSPILSPMIPLTVPSPVASPAMAKTKGFFTELRARIEMQGGLIHDHMRENQELLLQLIEERRAWLDLAEIVDSMRRGDEPRGDVRANRKVRDREWSWGILERVVVIKIGNLTILFIVSAFESIGVILPCEESVHGNYKPTIQKEGKVEIIPYEKYEESHKKIISKNDEAEMILYNALPKKEYERIFMCDTAKDIWNSLIITHQGNKQVKDNKIDLFFQKYEEFTISDDETIDCAFTRFNTIITQLKSLDESSSSHNHVRKFLRALPTKWHPKVTTIEESKDLSTLSLDELIGNLKVYEVILEKDSEISKSKKEKYKSLALKERKISSDEEGSCSDSDDEEYAMAVRDFKKFFRKRGKFVRQPHDDKKNFRKVREDKKEKEYRSEEDTKKDEICLMAHDTNEFGAFCDGNGITHNFSAPRTLQSNGVVERKNRTLQEMSRTMLNEQSTPQKFWCNAVDTSTYFSNRILIRPFLGKTPYELFKGTGVETIIYADSDHAGDYVDHKSTSGVCTFMRFCLTSWFSKKQTSLDISTTEAEYVSARNACQQALWMKQSLVNYDIVLDDIPILCDNKGAIDLSKNHVLHSRTKHIEIRHHFLRDNVQKGSISIEKVSSENNIDDILTKPLKQEPFNLIRLGLGLMEPNA
ncbi:copia protein [Tanacetum coccineum]